MSASGATSAITGRVDRLRAWGSHHRLVSMTTLTELVGSPLASIMTWFVIGIALGLPAILFVVLQNLSMASGDWGGKPRISIYLSEKDIGASHALVETLGKQAEIEQVRFISSDDALKEFQARSGFKEVLLTLDRNPLPHVVEVVPRSPDPLQLRNLVSSWEAYPEVDHVAVDLEWLERLFALLAFGQRLVMALAIVLGLGVMLVMGNTIRLAIENRRAEIEIVKLVGGTDAFVRRPFLYLGFWYGLGGAVVALILVQTSLLVLSAPVESLAQSYADDFYLRGPGFPQVMVMMVSGAALGVLGALLAVSRHLSDIEPD